MRLPVGAEDYAEHVAPRLLAAPAELVLAALPDLDDGARVLELAWTSGLLTRALCDVLGGGVEITTLEEHAIDPPIALPRGCAHVKANGAGLPFDDGAFDLVVGNLALFGRHVDGGRLEAVRRVLAPNGALCASVLMDRSFDELFDILTEVSEQEALPRVRAALTDARRALYARATLEQALRDAGFEVEAYGEEERALWFAGGKETIEDPLVRRALLAGWLEGVEPLDDRAVGAVARFIDTYFEAARFPVTVRTAVVRARVRG